MRRDAVTNVTALTFMPKKKNNPIARVRHKETDQFSDAIRLSKVV